MDQVKDLEIKRVRLTDIYQLQKITRQTFFETYGAVNTEENMTIYLEEEFSLEKLTGNLKNEECELYFAQVGAKVIGYLKLNFGQAQTDIKDNKTLEMERIYVLKEYHGKKIAQALYDKAISIATERNISYVWLGVWEKNPRAIRFYKKNGMVEFDKHVFQLGNDTQIDILMKRQVLTVVATGF